MRITESVLESSITEVNQQLEKAGSEVRLSLRNLSGGGGKIVERNIGKLSHDLTCVGEKNREVYNYLLGLSDGLANAPVPKVKKCAKSCKKNSVTVNLTHRSSGGGTFNELMTRVLNYEFDTSISYEEVENLAKEIDKAYSDCQLNSYEIGRVLEQFKMLTAVAVVQLTDGTRQQSSK